MPTRLGPVLRFRALASDSWQVSALTVNDETNPPPLTWSVGGGAGTNVAASKIHAFDKFTVWRYDFAVKQAAAEKVVSYSVGGPETWELTVPSKGSAPSMAYASCNGFSNPRDMKRVEDKNERWRDVAQQHKSRPLHLLLMGGDQVYADSMWEIAPSLKKWAELRKAKMVAANFTATMAKEVENFYFQLYCNRWFQPEPRAMLARIPTVMMWDDHDIMDGWGSYPEDLQTCAVYKGIFEIARRYFRIFQLQTALNDTPPALLPNQPAFGSAHTLGNVGLLVLDMRSERTIDRVMTEPTWTAVQTWMDNLQGCSHLLVMSSIPVVHPDFGTLERFLGMFPGQQDLEDDLKDHWCSRGHREERLRFIHRLLAFAKTKKCRVTLLSGDVHVGAVGVIESEREPTVPRNARVINQLTSSGIVHPPPPGMALHYLESLGDNVEEVDRDITARMLEFPGGQTRFIGTRNWMRLNPDPERRIWVEWRVAHDPRSYTKAIHPCD